MVIPGKVYEKLKWILMIVVPAFVTLLPLLANVWGWTIPVDAINTTITGIATFVGVCVGISNKNYYKDGE